MNRHASSGLGPERARGRPVIAGAQAMIVANPGRAPKGRPGVRVRARDGYTTGVE